MDCRTVEVAARPAAKVGGYLRCRPVGDFICDLSRYVWSAFMSWGAHGLDICNVGSRDEGESAKSRRGTKGQRLDVQHRHLDSWRRR